MDNLALGCPQGSRSGTRAGRAAGCAGCRPVEELAPDQRRGRHRLAGPRQQGASTNTLSEAVLAELDAVLGKVEQDKPKGLVIRSAKRGGFIAGADISDFREVKDAAKAETMIDARPCRARPARPSAVHHGRRDPRLLSRRRARGRARLRHPHRHRQCDVRISRSDARPASRARRHGAADAFDQSRRPR